MTHRTISQDDVRYAEIPPGWPADRAAIRICPVSGRPRPTPTTLPSLISARGGRPEPVPALRPETSRIRVLASSGHFPSAPQDRCTCGHLLDNHDRIATRYCAATRDGELARGCICTPPTDAIGKP